MDPLCTKELYQAGWWGPAETTLPMGPSFIARAPPGANKTLLIEWQLLLKSMLTTRVARGQAHQLREPSNGWRRRQIGWKCFLQWRDVEATLEPVRATEDQSVCSLSKNGIKLGKMQQHSWVVSIVFIIWSYYNNLVCLRWNEGVRRLQRTICLFTLNKKETLRLCQLHQYFCIVIPDLESFCVEGCFYPLHTTAFPQNLLPPTAPKTQSKLKKKKLAAVTNKWLFVRCSPGINWYLVIPAIPPTTGIGSSDPQCRRSEYGTINEWTLVILHRLPSIKPKDSANVLSLLTLTDGNMSSDCTDLPLGAKRDIGEPS